MNIFFLHTNSLYLVMSSPPVFYGVCVAHLFSFLLLWSVFILYVFILCLVLNAVTVTGFSLAFINTTTFVNHFIIFQAEHVSWGPAAIFVVMNMIVVVILLTLPETMGRELPTTVEEMKSWFKGRKGLFDVRWPKSYRQQSST